MKVVYDIPKNKLTIEAKDEKTQKDIKEIIIVIAACATLITGFGLYLDYKKELQMK